MLRQRAAFNQIGDVMSGPARVLTASDVRRVIAYVSSSRGSPRNLCIVLLSFRAGLRAAEIAGLDWSMVLRVDGKVADAVNVSAAIAKCGRRRTVPLHPELKRALAQQHRAVGRPAVGPVVRSQRGVHMSAKGVVNWFTKTYAALGFDGCSSHSGRRTFITQAARLLPKAGGSLRDVQELAGHRSLKTTEAYIVGDREAQRKLVRLLF